MGNWLGVVEGLVAAAVPVAGLIYTYVANKRSQYDRVLTLTAESGVPPVADDRHVAGMAFEPISRWQPDDQVPLSEAQIKAVFNVLWYFERADALYLSLRRSLRSDRITRTQALLLDSLGSAIESWAKYLDLAWAHEEGHALEADDTTGPLRHLVGERTRLAARRPLKSSPDISRASSRRSVPTRGGSTGRSSGMRAKARALASTSRYLGLTATPTGRRPSPRGRSGCAGPDSRPGSRSVRASTGTRGSAARPRWTALTGSSPPTQRRHLRSWPWPPGKAWIAALSRRPA
jgi:hypothetical protein